MTSGFLIITGELANHPAITDEHAGLILRRYIEGFSMVINKVYKKINMSFLFKLLCSFLVVYSLYFSLGSPLLKAANTENHSTSSLKPNDFHLKEARGCKAELKNDLLILENDLIQRIFIWNDGNLISQSITDKKNGFTLDLGEDIPGLHIPGTKSGSEGRFSVKEVEATPNAPWHLEAEVVVSFDSLDVKRVFRIYPHSPAIACDFYFRGTSKWAWTSPSVSLADLSNVENKAAEEEGKSSLVVLENLQLPGQHWKFKAVQFFDITDRNNNLVQEVEQIGYRSESKMIGNLLLAENLVNNQGIFILKEAPNSYSQLSYPGFDFITSMDEVKAVGPGLSGKDIDKVQWTRGYGFVVGVSQKNEVDKLLALRKYQENVRLHLPERDEMILMNTWGDRNQDKMIRERFILEELEAAKRLGITHFQIDDGWQTGRSANSAFAGGSFKNIWNNPDYWKPDPEKFPKGLHPVVKQGKELGIEICLWFNPSKDEEYKHWQKDADALIELYKEYGIRIFKIDGVQVNTKEAEINLRNMFDTVVAATNHEAVFNLDVTAGRRYGYHYFNEYGNIFLENRYTDWGNYYPHWTLRNLWMLSRYVPAQNLQVEFLNNFRNKDKYAPEDPLAPGKIPFDYLFAITMMGQPLVWMEASGLPAEGFDLAETITKYKEVQHDIHKGKILPIGNEPSGTSWTGFQSIQENRGYLVVFRENNGETENQLKTWLPEGKEVNLKLILGDGKSFKVKVGQGGIVNFFLSKENSYALYSYDIEV